MCIFQFIYCCQFLYLVPDHFSFLAASFICSFHTFLSFPIYSFCEFKFHAPFVYPFKCKLFLSCTSFIFSNLCFPTSFSVNLLSCMDPSCIFLLLYISFSFYCEYHHCVFCSLLYFLWMFPLLCIILSDIYSYLFYYNPMFFNCVW